jgi:hypothetical protein
MSVTLVPTPGQVAVLKATIGAGSTDYVFPAINWKLSVDGKVVDVSNFRDGRYKVGTLPDATLTFTLIWDANDEPTSTAAASVRTGLQGSAKCYTDSTHYFVVPICVSTADVNNDGVEDVLKLDVSCGLSGQITYPV